MKKILAEDVIVEILVKLPVKSLLRFRCVCKSWLDLIKTPNFIDMHLKHQCSTKYNDSILAIYSAEDRKKHLMSFHSYESLSVISSHHLQIPQFNYFCVRVCGPCNGLLCLSDAVTIVLCNPAMREFKVLPPRPFPCPYGWDYNANAIGLSFDSNTNDYKVVAIVRRYHWRNSQLRKILGTYGHEHKQYGDYSMTEADIYNLSTNSWKQINLDHDFLSIDYAPGYGTQLNGTFHWIAWTEENSCILSFDMSAEVFHCMELPNDYVVKQSVKKSLTVLNESLALFAWAGYFGSEDIVEIWVMHEYGVTESWTKQFIIGPATSIYRPISLWKNEAILIESFKGRLITYSLDTHEMNDFEIHGDRWRFALMVYQESLISIK